MNASLLIGWAGIAGRKCGTDGAASQGSRKRRSLRNCKASIVSAAVELVCFTGDIADWGLKEEYRLATTRFSLILNAL